MVQAASRKASTQSLEQQELMALRTLRIDVDEEIRQLQNEIAEEESRKPQLETVVLDARTVLDAERLKWCQMYEYPSMSFNTFQEAIEKSAADGRVLEITSDTTIGSEPVVLSRPCRILGRLVQNRRPVVTCENLQIKGKRDTDVWITGLEIAGVPADEEHVANTREMRTCADKYEQQKREALSPGGKMSRGLDVRSRTAILEVSGSVEFHMSDCGIHGEGRNGIEIGSKSDFKGSGLELSGGLAVGISVLDNAKVYLERTHIRDCRMEGIHVSSAGSFCFETSSIASCNDGFRIFGEQCTDANIILGPQVAIRDCVRHGVRLNTGACAAWAGGEISCCHVGDVHCQQGCVLSGWMIP